MAELVAITYGKALFEVAEELNKVDIILEEIDFIKEVFQREPDFYELYKSPQINRGEKKNILRTIFGDNISAELQNFMFVLIDKTRTSAFIEIAKEYIRLANEYKNIREGTIYTAAMLKDSQKQAIEARLSAITGKSIKLNVVVDSSLIGGLKVKIGDKVVDASVQNKLKNLKETIDTIIV